MKGPSKHAEETFRFADNGSHPEAATCLCASPLHGLSGGVDGWTCQWNRRSCARWNSSCLSIAQFPWSWWDCLGWAFLKKRNSLDTLGFKSINTSSWGNSPDWDDFFNCHRFQQSSGLAMGYHFQSDKWWPEDFPRSPKLCHRQQRGLTGSTMDGGQWVNSSHK